MYYEFENIFNRQPDEVTDGDYYYYLPKYEYRKAAMQMMASNRIAFSVNDMAVEDKIQTKWLPAWEETTLFDDRVSVWYEPWTESVNAVEILKKVAAECKSILDVASSESMGLVPYIVKLNKNIPALISDIDADVISNLRYFISKHLREYNLNLASFDNHDIPVCDNSLDCITSRYGITSSFGLSSDVTYRYSQDREKPIHELYRILRSGGRLVTIEMSRECEFDLYKIYNYYHNNGELFGVFSYDEMETILGLFTEDNWRTKFESAGFVIELEEKYYKKNTLGTVADFLCGFANYYGIGQPSKITVAEAQEQVKKWMLSAQPGYLEAVGINFFDKDNFFSLLKH